MRSIRKRTKCDQCDFVCTSKTSLIKHITTAHKQTHDNGQEKCDQCDFTCTSKTSLNRHIATTHKQTCDNGQIK